MAGSEGFSKKNRLQTSDVNRLFDDSQIIKSKLVLLRYRLNDLQVPRLVPIASKKAGKANVRNKIKRVMRDIFRKNVSEFYQSGDYAIVARYGFAESDYEQIKKDILYCARKCKEIMQKQDSGGAADAAANTGAAGDNAG